MYKRLFAVATLSLLVGIVTGTGLSHSNFGGTSSQTLTIISSDAVKGEVNQYRVQNDMGTLVSSGSLDESAQARAEFLCTNNQWSHDGWTESLAVYKATAVKVGENLQYGAEYQTPRTIVGSWANSPAHNANMLDPVFTEQGMGIKYCTQYQGQKQVVIVVNHFGKP